MANYFNSDSDESTLVVEMVSRFSSGFVCLLASLLVLVLSGSACADMSAPYNFYSSGWTFAVFLVVVGFNLPINLFWYSALVCLALLASKALPRKMPLPPLKFAVYLLLVVLCMTLLGALTDLELLYQLNEGGDHYVLSFGGVGWIVAAILIFITTYALSYFVMGLGLVRSLIPSVAIAALNPVFWFWLDQDYPHGTGADTFLLVVTILSPVAFIAACLVCWRKALQVKKRSDSPSEKAEDKQTQTA